MPQWSQAGRHAPRLRPVTPVPKRSAEIDAIHAACAPPVRRALEAIRRAVHAAVPGAEEYLTYGMPAVRFEGKPLVAWRAAAKHCAFHPLSGSTVAACGSLLDDFDTSPGTVRFSPERPLSAALVKRMVGLRIAENRALGGTKAKPAAKTKPAAKAKPVSKPKPVRGVARRAARRGSKGPGRLATILLVVAAAARGTATEVTSPDAAALWSAQVQPLLDVHCVKCHGPVQRHAGLALDTAAGVLAGGESGPAVTAGDPDASAIVLNLAAAADTHMPPDKQLNDEQIAVVREWVAALGAAPPAGGGPGSPPVVRSFAGPAEAIDVLVAEGWARRGLSPAAPLDDATWCRRVWLDLAGRIPTPPEVESFLAAPADSRRAALVDSLLDSDAHAVHMRELWDVFLLGRGKRESREAKRRSSGWWGWLERGFRTNRPWDETVRALLVARPADPGDAGSAWFLHERRNDHQAIAEAVAPLVYGVKIDCAQCHDHPLAREVKQAHYWGLVAAFNRGKNVDGSADVAESAVGGFVNFTNLAKESQPALITLLDGRTVEEPRPEGGAADEDADEKYVDPSASPRVPRFSRRAAFAAAATRDNPALARAFVNRLWGVFLGRGLVTPVDDMTVRNVPSHPELLDWLAADFAAHGHDIRRTVRGIVLSRVYGLAPAPGSDPAAFAGALERPLDAESLARSWCVAAGRPTDNDPLRRETVAAIPDVAPREYRVTVQQARFLASAPVLRELLEPVPGSTVAEVAAIPDPAGRVEALFRAAFGRAPDAEEAAAAIALLEARADAPAEAVRDLFWALLTSAEFLTMP